MADLIAKERAKNPPTKYEWVIQGYEQSELLAIAKATGKTPGEVLSKGFSSMMNSMQRVFVDEGTKDLEVWTCHANNDLERDARLNRRQNATVEVKLKLSPHAWGVFAQAGVVLGCSPEVALDAFVEASAGEWANQDFRL